MKKVILNIFLFLLSLALIEGSICIALKVRHIYTTINHPNKKLFIKNGVNDPALFIKELRELSDSKLHADEYKWYQLEPNYPGKFHRTDRWGYRNDRIDPTVTSCIGFFGGSTAYGITSLQNDTIPALLEQKVSQNRKVYNFGIGGYSTQPELANFQEILRIKDYRIKTAIFYDGVNEVYRYIEKLQEHANERYTIVGYPYWIRNISYCNFLKKNEVGLFYSSSFFYLFNVYLKKFDKSKNINYILNNQLKIQQAAKTIVDIYEHNINCIKGISHQYKIQSHFFWQPNMFEVNRKKLSNNDQRLAQSELVISNLFSETKKELILRKGLHDVVILTECLNEIDLTDEFFDFVHVGRKANEAIADKIFYHIK